MAHRISRPQEELTRIRREGLRTSVLSLGPRGFTAESMRTLVEQVRIRPSSQVERLLDAAANLITKERHIDRFLDVWMLVNGVDDADIAVRVLSRTGRLLETYIQHRLYRHNWFDRVSPEQALERMGRTTLSLVLRALAFNRQCTRDRILRHFSRARDPEIRTIATEALSNRRRMLNQHPG